MALPIGATEAVIILVVILIVFGVGKLPQVGGAIGKGIREFRRGKEGLMDDIKTGIDEDDEEEEAPKAPRQLTEGKTKARPKSKSKTRES